MARLTGQEQKDKEPRHKLVEDMGVGTKSRRGTRAWPNRQRGSSRGRWQEEGGDDENEGRRQESVALFGSALKMQRCLRRVAPALERIKPDNS